MKKLTAILIILFLIGSISLTAQENYVKNELIIRVKKGITEKEVSYEFKDINLTSVKVLSKRMNIWLYRFDDTKIDKDDVLYKIRTSNKIEQVQRNHFVELRKGITEKDNFNPSNNKVNIPNDPRFGEQWALNNTGQSSGTIDADIDAVEAWDLSFGGPTALNDEVVIAIIDGGIDLNHQDISYFKNELEIPNNGIDDDNNGYVDDYHGWDAYSSDGTIPSDDHGTHVAGIAAAIGNNGLGVVGVNPNAKILPIAGSSGTESIVVEAYGYVLEMRARYNETNGAEGAFIVATNASFGVDYGNPANYPIWCGIYDDLGEVGVLSCGATANINLNVDVQGDVPTACGSDFLISVTNTTDDDLKNSGAAYGATTIDLGAPGTSILNATPGNSYGYKTGTSMATPTVTGAIALLYSAANESLMQSYKENPAEVALQMRQFLLESVDPISSLNGITVTGGRLNIYNAILNVIAEPDDIPPTVISDLTVTDTTSNSLTITWTVPSDTTRNGVVGYDIRYSTFPINDETDFQNAEQFLYEGTPNEEGELESVTFDSLSFETTYYFAVKAYDFWLNISDMSNTAVGKTYMAPVISVTPNQMYHSAEYTEEISDTIALSNISAGASTLDYSVELMNNTFPEGKVNVKLIPQEIALKAKSKNEKSSLGYFGFRESGGPDNFGYEWIDSDEPNGPQFIWNDISTTGELASSWVAVSSFNAKDEGYSGPFNLGFNFKYYGIEYSEIYINSNGFMTFSPPTSTSYTNNIFPTGAAPNGIIAPFWDDLDGSNGNGKVYYKNDGNKFIIQFTDWKRYSSSSPGTFTFQVVINASGSFNYYYYSMTGTKNESVIGFENESGQDGLTIDYRSGYAKNNLAVKIAAEPDWMFTAQQSGTIYNGFYSNIIIDFSTDTELLPGLYEMDIKISSNDPINPEMVIPVSYNLGGVVPVELTSFEASVGKDDVVLNWSTATETNNQGFEIERASEEKKWTRIGYVEGNGNSTSRINYSYTDKVSNPGIYFYRLKQIDYDGSINYSKEIETEVLTPVAYTLKQNFPNPFNPATSIEYSIPNSEFVSLKVFDVLGNEVASLVNEVKEPGNYSVNFEASSLTSGIYFYTINSGKFYQVKKMMLLK